MPILLISDMAVLHNAHVEVLRYAKESMMRSVIFNVSLALLLCYAGAHINAVPSYEKPNKCGCIEDDPSEITRYVYIPPQVAKVLREARMPANACLEVATVLSYLKNGVQLCPHADLVPALKHVAGCVSETDKAVLQQFERELDKYKAPMSNAVKAPGVVRLLNCQTAVSCSAAVPPNFDQDITVLQGIQDTLCSGAGAACNDLDISAAFCGQLAGRLINECSGILNSLPDNPIFICDIKTNSIQAGLGFISRFYSNTACLDVAAVGALGAQTACIGTLIAGGIRATTACLDTAITDQLFAGTACLNNVVVDRIAADTACIQNADVCQLLLQDLFLENSIRFDGSPSNACFPQAFGEIFLPWSAWSEPIDFTSEEPPFAPPAPESASVEAATRSVNETEPELVLDDAGASAVTRSICAPTSCILQVARERIICPYTVNLFLPPAVVKGAKLFRAFPDVGSGSGTFVDILVPADYDGQFELDVALILDRFSTLTQDSPLSLAVARLPLSDCSNAQELPEFWPAVQVPCPTENITSGSNIVAFKATLQLSPDQQAMIQPGDWIRLALFYDDFDRSNNPCLLVNGATFRYTRKDINEAFAIFPG